MIPERSDLMRWTNEAYGGSVFAARDVLRYDALPALVELLAVVEHYEKTLRAYASPGSFGFQGDQLVAERALRGIAPDGSECPVLVERAASS